MRKDGKKILGYRDAMVMPAQPKSMVIVGSGAIGSEFAYFYAAMGTKVTLVEFMQNIVPVEDDDVSKALAKSFKNIGIDVLTATEVTKVDTSGSGCKVTLKDASGEKQIECDVVLSAAGVVANLENIGLEVRSCSLRQA
jgi:dihydrolipoamide dehydrogenase